MPDLQRALEIAVYAHRDQQEKNGSPYILHPLRIMLSLNDREARIVAVLHDVVEDTAVELQDLKKEGFSDVVIKAVDLLTHRDNDHYDDYIAKLGRNRLARMVKLADLKDNMDTQRIPNLSKSDLKRLSRYHRAWKTLSEQDAKKQKRNQ